MTGIPYAPEHFTEMKLTYKRSYGGPGCALNPFGRGFAADNNGRLLLPNIQDPKHIEVAPGKRSVIPAGFAPYPLNWPQRAENLGSFDRNWVIERWPYLPVNTNPEYFNTAPSDQRIEGYFRGDERVRIVNMHPQSPELLTSLPGLRARMFINERGGSGTRFREIFTRAETVWLFPNQETGIILYRGLAGIVDEDASNIVHLMAEWELLAEQLQPPDHYREKLTRSLERRLPDEPAAVASPVPPPHNTEPAASALPVPPDPAAGVEAAALEKQITELEKQTEAHLKELGLTREEVMKKYMPSPESQKASLDPKVLEKQITELEKQTEARLNELGLTKEEALKKYLPGMVIPAVSAAEMGALLSALEAEKAADKKTGHQPDVLQTPKQDELPAGAKPLTPDEVLERYSSGQGLEACDLTGCDLTGFDLHGGNFRDSILERTELAKADITGAIFTGAIMTDCNLAGANADGAIFDGANGTCACLAGATLTNARFSRSDFTSADFTGADLSGASLENGYFEKAEFTGSKGSVQAFRAIFRQANLTGVDLTGSDLTEADLSEATLTNARLKGISARGLRLYGATGERTDFTRAMLENARGDDCTVFIDPRLVFANLKNACFDGMTLKGARMEEANLDGADLSRALLEKVRMKNSSAKRANFTKAQIHAADLRGINLFKGSLRRATIFATDLRQSNLYGVDLYKASIEKSDIKGANIARTLLALPERR
jgi:uncharacterized protein YjbI with pentapeptide repeats